jgi:hypothetical protein
MNRKNINSLMALYNMMAMESFSQPNKVELRPFNPNYSESKKTKVIPKGHMEYFFEDGFNCHALNQKNADKKHDKWLINSKLS